MSEYQHSDFGNLTGTSTAEEHDYHGNVEIDGFGSTKIHITGDGARPIDDIVDAAARSLQIYRARENEFRKTMLDSVVTKELMDLIHSDVDPGITRQDVRDGFSNIFLINFHVSEKYPGFKIVGYTEIIYEDVEGFLGYDMRVVGDLSFESILIEEGV